jgi:hypothetical protein
MRLDQLWRHPKRLAAFRAFLTIAAFHFRQAIKGTAALGRATCASKRCIPVEPRMNICTPQGSQTTYGLCFLVSRTSRLALQTGQGKRRFTAGVMFVNTILQM